MSMRSYLAQSLKDSAGLASLGLVPAGVIAGDVDTVRERPFVNLKWQGTNRGMARSDSGPVRRFLNLWVHDEPNDYTRIDDMLFVIKALWSGIEGAQHGSGVIMLIEWQNDSLDIKDDAMMTIARFSTYRIVGTEGVA